MDLKKLSMKEMHENKDRERAINWSTPFLRLPGLALDATFGLDLVFHIF